MQYYVAVNTGVGFITHEDNQRSHIAGYPANVWVTENNQTWATRVGAVEKTKAEAQALVDAVVNQTQTEWQTCVSGSTPWLCGPEPQDIILP
jgi:hypothetical protein